MPRTLNIPVHLFFSQKIRTQLPKFKADDSVGIVFEPLQALSISYTPRQAFNLQNSLMTLAIVLARYSCKGKGSESITIQG